MCVINQGDRTGVALGNGHPGSISVAPGDHAADDGQHPAERGRARGKQEAQREGKAQHPLADRVRRKDVVHQQRRGLGSGSCFALPPASMQSSAIRRAPRLGQNPHVAT